MTNSSRHHHTTKKEQGTLSHPQSSGESPVGPFPALWAPSLCPCSLLGPPSAETCNILQHPATVHPKASEILSLVQVLHENCSWARGHGASLHYLHCTSLCGNPPQLEAPSARRRHLPQAPSPREQTPKTALTAEGLSFSSAWEASKSSELAGKRGLQCVSGGRGTKPRERLHQRAHTLTRGTSAGAASAGEAAGAAGASFGSVAGTLACARARLKALRGAGISVLQHIRRARCEISNSHASKSPVPYHTLLPGPASLTEALCWKSCNDFSRLPSFAAWISEAAAFCFVLGSSAVCGGGAPFPFA